MVLVVHDSIILRDQVSKEKLVREVGGRIHKEELEGKYIEGEKNNYAVKKEEPTKLSKWMCCSV